MSSDSDSTTGDTPADIQSESGPDDDGYVHRPVSQSGSGSSVHGSGKGLGRAGWILVGAVVVSILVIPGLIYLYPTAPGDSGLSFLFALLVLPFLPAVLLGIVAVWSMTAGNR